MCSKRGLPTEEDYVLRVGNQTILLISVGNGDDRGREGSFVMRLMTEARSNAGMEPPLVWRRKSCAQNCINCSYQLQV